MLWVRTRPCEGVTATTAAASASGPLGECRGRSELPLQGRYGDGFGYGCGFGFGGGVGASAGAAEATVRWW
ncbi:MAG: hypothetical protein QM757_41140 [Paludibaculum sp.]